MDHKRTQLITQLLEASSASSKTKGNTSSSSSSSSMAKQKVVLKLAMEDAKKRAKAMQCAVGMHGVLSVSHEGDKMTVVGEGIDSVELTRLLRKKMGHVDLVVVAAVEEKKEKEVKVEAQVKSNVQPVIMPYYYGQSVGAMTQPSYYYGDVREPSYDQNNCSIM